MAKRQAAGRKADPVREAMDKAAADRMFDELDAPRDGELVGAPASDEDEQLVVTAGKAVVEFFRGLAAFFGTARELERRAFETRDRMKELAKRVQGGQALTAAEDENLQRAIRVTSEDKREVENHWKITTTISSFHRRMTARRAQATDALDEANKIGNTLHNNYVAAEQRRVQEENRRREEEIRRRQEEERAAEAARLELEAVKREEAAKDLSGREQVFVEQMARHGDGVRAARDAGFPDPAKSSARLLKMGKITAAIEAAQQAAQLRRQATAVQQRPIQTEPFVEERPNILKAPGAQTRSYHYGDLVDEQALVAAILSGKHGIPTDLLRIDTSKLNQYANDLGDRINRWPGVSYRKETKVV